MTWLEVLPLEHVHGLQVAGETELLHHDLQPPAGERVGEHNDPVHHRQQSGLKTILLYRKCTFLTISDIRLPVVVERMKGEC